MPTKTMTNEDNAQGAKKVAAEKTVKAVTKATDKAEEKKPLQIKKRNLDPHALIVVKNGFNGKLIYRSARTGEKFVWDSFGSELDMELQDLRAAKNSAKAFFENNWFLIDDVEVLEYLGVERMYRGSLSADEFDEIFSLPADKLEERLSSLPRAQKPAVAYRAKKMISEGKIDSMKTIRMLEKYLGIELIEK